MTADEVYQAYLLWLKGARPVPRERLFQCAFAHQDVFEGDRKLVNRLFFILPGFPSDGLRCFFFYEENEFYKDAAGDLHLVLSTYHLGLGQPEPQP